MIQIVTSNLINTNFPRGLEDHQSTMQARFEPASSFFNQIFQLLDHDSIKQMILFKAKYKVNGRNSVYQVALEQTAIDKTSTGQFTWRWQTARDALLGFVGSVCEPCRRLLVLVGAWLLSAYIKWPRGDILKSGHCSRCLESVCLIWDSAETDEPPGFITWSYILSDCQSSLPVCSNFSRLLFVFTPP